MSSKGLASAVALVCLSYGGGCGLAARQPGGATTAGASEEARQEQRRAMRQEEVASRPRPTGEQARQGITDALAEPETRAQPRRGVDARVSQPPRSVPGGEGPSAAEGPVATAGPRAAGEGPGVGGANLAGEMAEPVIEEPKSEPGAVFPQCEGLRGEAARTCMEAGLAAFGASVAQAAAGEVREALQPWLLLLTAGGGLLVVQFLLNFLSLFMARGATPDGPRAPRPRPGTRPPSVATFLAGARASPGMRPAPPSSEREVLAAEDRAEPRPGSAVMSEQREEEGHGDEREQVGQTEDRLRGEPLLTLEELERWRAQALDVQHRLGHLQEEKRELLRKVGGAALGLLVLEGGHSRRQARRRERLLSLLLREGDGHAPAGLLTSLRARIYGGGWWRGEEG
ncbi:hypothetical protein ACN28I_16685 [Archangium gephyra]|uniref:hypothetical protein n=1 Tax=Archangium gephyra TaxID=48 RepID=UPI003B761C5A